MLILSVAESMAGAPTLADRAFLSYQYDGGSGDFIVQSRHLAATNSPNSENQFGDWLQLRDANFYFAWISFTNPLAPVGVPGDYNADGAVDAADYAVWRDNLDQSVTLPNDSTPGTVDATDYDVWKAHFGQTVVSGAITSSGAAVPEPNGVSSLLGASVVLLGRFARHRRLRR